MTEPTTLMRREILEVPDAVERLPSNGRADMTRAADAMRARDPSFFVSVARGGNPDAPRHLKKVTETV